MHYLAGAEIQLPFYLTTGSKNLTFPLNNSSISGKEGFCLLLKIQKNK